MITIPWPPATLSGHAKGNSFWAKANDTKKHREFARLATLAADKIEIAEHGVIKIRITFNPPDRRGDRQNFPNRIKPALDGVADGLGVNDNRFLPEYVFGEPMAGGRVTVEVMP
jgi:hypothetical protein